jgi:hypothetical protein
LKARRCAQQRQRPARRSSSPPGSHNEGPIRPQVIALAAVETTTSPSVISISSDSDISEPDGGGSLNLAPLLIARSRTRTELPQRRLTTLGEDLGQEVIDLT